MKKIIILAGLAAVFAFVACKETKKSTDIIVKKEVKKEHEEGID